MRKPGITPHNPPIIKLKDIDLTRDRELLKEELLVALNEYLGTVSYACAKVGIGRDLFYHLLREDPNFATRVNEVKENTLDYVENKLYELISSGNEKAIMFYLRQKGGSRGYTMAINNTNFNIETNKDDSGKIKINIILPDGTNINNDDDNQTK
jgi:hypothetical protein